MKVILCGVGNIGFRVSEILLSVGETVTTITTDKDEPFLKRVSHSCQGVIEGDAREKEVLLAAGAASADVLMALTGDDMVNLEISIVARDINPALRIITRMFDEVLSYKIQSGFQIQKALSASYLAASSFVSAAMNESVLSSFECGGRINHVIDFIIPEGSALDGLSMPSAEKKYDMKIIRHERGGAKTRDFSSVTLQKGDAIILSCFGKDILKKISPAQAKDKHAHAQPHTGIVKHLVDALKGVSRNVRLIAVAYSSLIVLATAIFHFGLNMSPVDALYFVITTTTTVGYGDFNLQNAPVAFKLFGCLVMLAGASVLAALFSLVTDGLISKRFNQYFGIGKSRMKGHVVIAGLGNIGYRVANLLHAGGEKIIAIERNTECEFLATLRGRIPVIFGSALHHDTLETAGIKNARAFLALTDDDLVNLHSVLNVRAMNPSLHTVARIFNTNIGRKAVTAFGIPAVLSTSSISAPIFVGSAIYHNTIYAFFHRNDLYLVVELTIEEHVRLTGLNGQDVINRYQLYPFLVKKTEGAYMFLSYDDRLQKEDTIIAVAEYHAMKRFSE